MAAKNIIVRGKVQGVYYRASTKAKADELGLQGFVMNQADGSVLIVVDGPVDKITRLFEWCKRGPQHARVEQIKISNDERTDSTYSGFEVRYKKA